jgi:hypothetical protein
MSNDSSPLKRSYRLIAIGVCLVLLGLSVVIWNVLNREPEEQIAQPVAPPSLPKPTVALPRVIFTDITRESGIDFIHNNGAESGNKFLPETMGAGCVFFDYDNDQDQDLLLVNSRAWPSIGTPENSDPTLAFYQNDGSGVFTEITEELGLALHCYGMGGTAADYDNDGFVDLFITGVGGNFLLKNIDGERFDNVTLDAGVGGPGDWPSDPDLFNEHTDPITWSSSAAWLDYDQDGHLDLFVCNYVRWSPIIDLELDYRLTGIGRAFGPPTNYSGSHCFLYRNSGNGHFEDVSKSAGIQVFSQTATQVPVAKSLGVVASDIDEDGWIDLVVANDTVENFFFHNQEGHFVEKGTRVGLATDTDGNSTGAMGIDSGQPRNDGMVMIPVGNFSNEMTSLYVRQRGTALTLYDEARSAGIGAPTRQSLTFGTLFLDIDLDGRLDLISANGHLEEEINQHQPGQHYQQPPQLFWNIGPDNPTEFVALTEKELGPDFVKPMIGRGLAYADIDNDGDLDVLITENGGSPRLLRNDLITPDSEQPPFWIRLVLEGTQGNRTAIGARVELIAEGGTFGQRREICGGRSYLSQPEMVITFGLGSRSRIDEIRIQWSGSSTVQVVSGLKVNQTHHIRQTP